MAYDKTKDPYYSYSDRQVTTATEVIAITPSDTVDLTVYPIALWVNVAGNLEFIPTRHPSDTPVVLAVPAGMLNISVRRVLAGSTTASGIFALYN